MKVRVLSGVPLIMNDKYEEIDIDIDEQTFLAIALLAHENDITFNQMCNKILKKSMEKLNDS